MGIFSKEKKVVFAIGHLLESETLNTSKMACGHVSEDDFASVIHAIDNANMVASIGYSVLDDGKIRINIVDAQERE